MPLLQRVKSLIKDVALCLAKSLLQRVKSLIKVIALCLAKSLLLFYVQFSFD